MTKALHAKQSDAVVDISLAPPHNPTATELLSCSFA